MDLEERKKEEVKETALPVCLPTRPVCGYAPVPRPEHHKKYIMIKEEGKNMIEKCRRSHDPVGTNKCLKFLLHFLFI